MGICALLRKSNAIEINKDVVRRVLQHHFKKYPGNSGGPSWLSFLANTKDSLWSVDFLTVNQYY